MRNKKEQGEATGMEAATVVTDRVGGRRLRVATWRLGTKSNCQSILFFNGIGANIETAAPLANALSDRAFITLEMPGTGNSPDPSLPYNPAVIAWTAACLLDKLGVDRVDVMGVSWGGAIAQHFALQHANRVRRLVLAATTPGVLMVPGELAALAKMFSPRRFRDPAFTRRNFAAIFGGADFEGSDDFKSSHMGRTRAPTRRGYFYQILAMLGWTSLPFLPMLRAKTLVLMGDADRIVPVVNGRILARCIPKAELKIIPGGGHLFLLSHLSAVAVVLRNFLR